MSQRPILLWGFVDDTERDAHGFILGARVGDLCYVAATREISEATVVLAASSTWVPAALPSTVPGDLTIGDGASDVTLTIDAGPNIGRVAFDNGTNPEHAGWRYDGGAPDRMIIRSRNTDVLGVFDNVVFPATPGAVDLGTSGNQFNDLRLSGRATLTGSTTPLVFTKTDAEEQQVAWQSNGFTRYVIVHQTDERAELRRHNAAGVFQEDVFSIDPVNGTLSMAGATLVVVVAGGATLTGGLGVHGAPAPAAQAADPGALTDNTGGAVNNTLVAVPPINGSGATTAQEAAINDNFADLIDQVNQLRAMLSEAAGGDGTSA